MECIEDKKENTPVGVMSIKNEKHHYVLDIVWRDGKRGEYSFPESGFEIADPQSKEKLYFMEPQKAIEILKANAKNYNQGEFNWLDFIIYKP